MTEALRRQDITSCPTVTVCVLTYNHEATIEKCLAAILAQTTTFDFDVLVHDDASEDSTVPKIEKLINNTNRKITLIKQSSNQYSTGVKIMPTIVMPKAKGDFIAICDGDDFWQDPFKLQSQWSFLSKSPQYSMAYHAICPFDDTGTLNVEFGGASRDLSQSQLEAGAAVNTSTVMLRNIFRTKSFPASLHYCPLGDIAIWFHASQCGSGKYLSDIAPTMYRVSSSGLHSKTAPIDRLRKLLITKLMIFRELTTKQKKLNIFLCASIIGLSIKYLRMKLFG